jgi:hypothetical protein
MKERERERFGEADTKREMPKTKDSGYDLKIGRMGEEGAPGGTYIWREGRGPWGYVHMDVHTYI